MPELPEVETVRRSIAPVLLGRTITRVRLYRPDVVTGSRRPENLLAGKMVTALDRRGKQLVIQTADACLCVHLGMTGSLCFKPAGSRGVDASRTKHTHVSWELAGGNRIDFRDPRRFGGIWTFASIDEIRDRHWQNLGPDALRVSPEHLQETFQGTCRNLKAVLLDQSVLAGLGNIYADELLFACGLHPRLPARRMNIDQSRTLVREMRRLLRIAIKAGGSTIRDYVNGQGEDGWFQINHRVYGRTNQPCTACEKTLTTQTIAGRATVFCGRCQPYRVRRIPASIERI